MPDHDHPYKLLFSHPEMVRDLLVTFVREDWVRELDFSTLERGSGSFVTDDFRERETDVVWSVRWGSRRLYVYLLIEFQSASDRFMAVRLMTYLGLLYQDLIRTGTVGDSGMLPAVLPLVLYNGKPLWAAPVDLGALIEEVPGGLERYRPSLHYLLIDELRWAESELTAARNLVAALFRLERSRDPGEVRGVVRELAGWLRAPEQAGLRGDFSKWFTRTFLPGRAPGQFIPEFNDLQEVDAMLSETVVEWTKQWEKQGLDKGREDGFREGREKGRDEGRDEGRNEGRDEGRKHEQHLVARRLLARGMSVTEVAEVTDLSVDAVEALRREG
ncbi:MAG: Rpn family recombination-promoting nuclease/putative transposase [Candidatus Riflebacteria bacterium]|nr:Rpn family recombination-promoting nuclease/putative transposase [Candidatus Riflebacteria bacterium]